MKKIVKEEVRFAVHIPRNDERDDYHYVKVLLTYDDGSRESKVKLLKDYLRPVYVTKENARNHIEKKEYEHLDNLNCQMATDSDAWRVAANMLGTPHLANRKNLLEQSPYLYGMGMTAANHIKLESIKRNDGIQSPYTVATFDVETNPANDELRIASITREIGPGKYEVFAVIESDWVKDIGNVESIIRRRFKDHYPEESDDIVIEMEFHGHQLDMIKSIFAKCNRWAPDFLGIWNMDFDIRRIILGLLKRYGESPIDYICDQRLPRELRYFRWVEAPETFTTAGGVHVSKQPADRWHKCFSTTTFQIVDMMCSYRALRLHEPREPAYSLDYILNKVIGSGKLKIEESEGLTGIDWHLWMQKNRKVDYIIYNFGDNIEPLKLEKKTKDLSVSLPVFAEATDFNDFGSSNKKAYCSLYDFCLENDVVLGTGADMTDVYNKYAEDEELPNRDAYRVKIFSTRDWIQTLPQSNVLPMGIMVFDDFPNLITGARGYVSDMDSVSSYPSCLIAGNVSRSTTVTMVCEIEGLDEYEAKLLCLGTIVGNTNTLELGYEYLNLPSPEEIHEMCEDGRIHNY